MPLFCVAPGAVAARPLTDFSEISDQGVRLTAIMDNQLENLRHPPHFPRFTPLKALRQKCD